MTNLFDEIPVGEPAELVVGDLWTWKRTDLGSDYPPADYTLSYVARVSGSTSDVTMTASATGSDYLISESSTSSNLAGWWHWTAFITRNSDGARIKIDEGTFKVLANPADVDADPRSHARKMLDAIEALIEGRSTSDVQNYQITTSNGSRSLTKLTLEELMKWRDYYRREVNRERQLELRKVGKSAGNVRVAEFE